MVKLVRKRNGMVVPFEKEKVANAIWKAAQAVGGTNQEMSKELAENVCEILEEKFTEKFPTVEDVQDAVEKVLVEGGHYRTSKAFILYREEHKKLRDVKGVLLDVSDVIDNYISENEWRIKENANIGFSYSGLMWHGIGTVIAYYALNNVYPKEITTAHSNGDFHLHNLSMSLCGYCAGWSLRQLLMEGFNGVPGKVHCAPAKHLRSAVAQMVNFIGVLQNEWAGAQAFSSFDTYLAPFVRADNLSYDQVKQCMQEYIYGMNVTSRWGGQTPFSNITLDWTVPEDLKDNPVIIGGKVTNDTYADYQKEMDVINKAFIEVMTKGDQTGQVFTWPIPTYNITKDLDWNNENLDSLFKMTAKYGLPYFQNFIKSDLKPTDVRAMCCRLQLDLRDLRHKTGGLFGFGESTGSLGVVTINMPRIGYTSREESQYFEKLDRLMYLAKNSLELKRKVVERMMGMGMLPYSKRYLGNLDHHFSTIGLIGMNESCLNFLGQGIATPDGKDFSLKVLEFMRKKIAEYQEETGHIYNLEATPGEGTSFRLARIDKKQMPGIKTYGERVPYYTNSTQLPVDHTADVFEALTHQEGLQRKYTGGTVFHTFLGESPNGGEEVRQLVKKIASGFAVPYFTITPTFSVCPVHGYIRGERPKCPTCHARTQVYSRVVGYIRPINTWNQGKSEEYRQRVTYKAPMIKRLA
ncbi:MAG: ribonucleoside triphosphate reductase [Candidatus Aenigmarchaeota archaeon]|nr:ribonucleoside triphosphate reductase [Candidatus Aenigmarchaeota archaeon]